MRVAIIPARGGSKRIPKKNIKIFHGRPIIYWSIKAAQKAKIFNKIIVSTDSKKIAKIAKYCGAEVPFMRSKKLSDDKTSISEVIVNSIIWLRSKGYNPSNVCCISATAPFIKVSDIVKGYNKLLSNNWKYVFSATAYEYPIQRSFGTLKNKGVKMLFPKYYNCNSQKFSQMYHDAGQFYWGNSETWIKKKIIFDDKSSIVPLSNWRVQDIDTPHDWKHAEIKYKILKLGKLKLK